MQETPSEAIEAFHLTFLAHLSKDPNKAVVKGGQNLRLFFESVRHSDDLDMDVSVTSKERLKKKVDKILASPRFRKALLLYGIEIGQVSNLKQTDTTQRWKMTLKVKGLSEPVHTRIEFSRPASTAESVLGPVAKRIADSYGSSPFSASHYGLEESIAQKVSALAGRDTTRDLFDLAMLLERYAKDVGPVTALHPPSEQAAGALKRALKMTFDAYKAEVLPYLEKSKRIEHGNRQSWEEKKAVVVQALEIFSR
ncbi:MAG: nucleotidyl transferase AbiEii/AbiGii toxin family protein [Verrucomicrobiota bacterium]